MPRIVLSGGGTGGHLTPILSLAQALKQLDRTVDIHLITEVGQLSDQLISNQALNIHGIKAGKWRRYTHLGWWVRLTDWSTWVANLRDLFWLIQGLGQSLWQLMQLKPRVVFAKGGYVGLPVGLAAWLLGIPLVIHESDVRAGLTNRLLAHLARTIAVGWPVDNYPKWSHKRLVFSGNMIPEQMLKADKPGATAFFKLKPTEPTLLVMGGSIGARVLNQFVIDHLEALLRSWQIIHIAGTRNLEQIQGQLPRGNQAVATRYRLYDFLPGGLGWALAMADVVISRGGANTLAEIAVAGKPAILVPIKHSAVNHQWHNAQQFEAMGAGVVVVEDEMNKKLMQTLEDLGKDGDRRRAMSQNLRKLRKTDAALTVAKEIMRFL